MEKAQIFLSRKDADMMRQIIEDLREGSMANPSRFMDRVRDRYEKNLTRLMLTVSPDFTAEKRA